MLELWHHHAQRESGTPQKEQNGGAVARFIAKK